VSDAHDVAASGGEPPPEGRGPEPARVDDPTRSGPRLPAPGGPDPRRDRTVRRTAVVAFVAVLASLLGLAWTARPLSTPTQDCGTALTFLLEGGVDEPADPADPPEGVTREQALANNQRSCQERAAGRARPGGVLLIGGMVVALGALVTEQVVRYRYRRDLRRNGPAGTA
jgi:ferric-dicitrate binding protein FerR (iron transport regulator)